MNCSYRYVTPFDVPPAWPFRLAYQTCVLRRRLCTIRHAARPSGRHRALAGARTGVTFRPVASALEQTTMSARVVPLVATTLQKAGADPSGILSRVGLKDCTARSHEGRISHARVLELLGLSMKVTHDPAFSLRVAQSLHSGALGAIDYLIRTNSTWRQALQAAQRYQALIQDAILYVERSGDRVVQRYCLPGGRQLPGPLAECVLGGAAVWARQLTGMDIDPIEVHFSQARPARTRTHQGFFRAALRFGMPQDAIVFPASALDLPLVSAEPGLNRLLERYAARLLACLPRGEPVCRDATSRALEGVLTESVSGSAEWYRHRVNRLKRRMLRCFVESGGDITDTVDVDRFFQFLHASTALLPPTTRIVVEQLLGSEDIPPYAKLAAELSRTAGRNVSVAALRQRISRGIRALEQASKPTLPLSG